MSKCDSKQDVLITLNVGQARSLGSQAAEIKVSSPRRRLDIFALDLLEEGSALHGSLVWRQVSAATPASPDMCKIR